MEENDTAINTTGRAVVFGRKHEEHAVGCQFRCGSVLIGTPEPNPSPIALVLTVTTVTWIVTRVVGGCRGRSRQLWRRSRQLWRRSRKHVTSYVCITKLYSVFAVAAAAAAICLCTTTVGGNIRTVCSLI